MNFDLASFGSLFSIPQKNGLTRPKKVRGSGLPMVNMGELFSYPRIGNIQMDLVPFSDSQASFLLEKNDLLFARQSLVLSGAGQCSIFVGDGIATTFESHLIRCRLKRSVSNPLFYFYYFRSPIGRTAMETIVEQGAGASGIRGSDLVKLQVPLLPKFLQDDVAVVLGSLDDRIELLRETNTTLEAIAQALFKSWFVDFDPVHANATLLPSPSGRGAGCEGAENETLQNSLPHPNPLPKGEGAVLPSKIAALFPDSFQESELGLVPSGWRVTTFADAFEINPKRTLKKGTIAPYLEMAKLATSGHCVETPIQREMGSGAKFRNGDTLLARITPCLENGKSAFVDFLYDDQVGWGSTEFLVLRPKAPMSEYFGYLLCRHPVFREYAIQSMSGTSGRQRIQNDVLGRYLVTLPDDAVASAFTEVVDVIQKSIAGNHETAKTLAILRDTLLPRLISGQLRLPETESLVEEISA